MKTLADCLKKHGAGLDDGYRKDIFDIAARNKKNGYNAFDSEKLAVSSVIEDLIAERDSIVAQFPKKSPQQQRLDTALKDESGTATVVPATTMAQKSLQKVAKLFGLKTVFWESKDPGLRGVNGFMMPEVTDEIYINVSAGMPIAFSVGHETLHQLKNNHKDLYKFLTKNITVSNVEFEAYKTKFREARKGSPEADASDAYIKEELIADFLGDQFQNPEFWSKLNAQNPAMTARIVDVVLGIINKIKGAVGIEGTQHIKNFDQSLEAIVKAMAEYINRAAEARGETMVGEAAPGTKFSKVTPRREKKSGRYIGAPDWVGSSPQSLGALRRTLKQLTLEGEYGRYWYENSSKAILELAGGNKEEAELLVSLIAIYSPNATVPANTTMALTAYHQWKNRQPIKAGFGMSNKKAEDLLLRGKVWDGIKTNSFYQNLMVEINPEKLDPGVATMDMWMALAFDYGSKKLDQGPKYKFSEGEINNVAADMGWEPHQVQAAIWTAMKSRIDPIRAALKEKELKLGIGELYERKGKELYRVKKGREYDHFKLAHKMGMESDPKVSDVEAASYDFSNALADRTAQISWEATPSKDVADVSFIHTADTATKFKYLEGIQGVLNDKDGNDVIAQMVGLPDIPHLFGYSAWEGDIGAGAQDFVPVPLQGSGKNRSVKADAREVLNLYSALRGLVLRQDAVVWHVPIYEDIKKRHNGFELRTSRPVTEDEISLLYSEINKKFGTWDIAPGYIENGVRALNFTENIGNIEFQKGMDEIISALPDDFGGGDATWAGYRSDGDYIFNDWTEDKNGERYTNRINTRRPDLQKRIASLRSRVEAFNKKFTEDYESKPKFSKTNKQGSPGTVLRLTHYGRTKGLKELDPNFHGSGLRGAESKRKEADPDHWVNRTYFGLEGYKKEPGLGSEVYTSTVNQDKIYDLVEDPDNLKGQIQGVIDASSGWEPNRLSVYEQLIEKAGYDGYHSGPVVAMFKPTPVSQDQGIKFSKASPVKSKAFKKWFGDSKVVDGNGDPKVVAHGTPEGGFTIFDPSKLSGTEMMSAQGVGFYFGDVSTAKAYTKKGKDQAYYKPRGAKAGVIKAYLSLQNPLEIGRNTNNIPFNQAKQIYLNGDKPWFFSNWIPFSVSDRSIAGKTHTQAEIEAMSDGDKVDLYIKYQQSLDGDISILSNMGRAYQNMGDLITSMEEVFGKDGIIYTDRSDSIYVAFRSTQIKSATGNVGTFDAENPDIRFSKVTDKKLLNKLESGKKTKVFRAMQLIDGKLYPPMSAKINGEMREPTQIGQWEQADENPELAKNGKFKLDKANKSAIAARYNPYFHTSASPLNDQFSSAYKRPNLVTVEAEIPTSELTDGYQAEGAKDSVGEKQWNAGPVSSKLPTGKKRTVILSRWAKVKRVVPDSEVAAGIAKMLKGENLSVPDNVVTPSLREELKKQGVKISGSRYTKNILENSDTYQDRVLYSKTKDSAEFKGWSKGYPVYEGTRISNIKPGVGFVAKVYHGTTHSIEEFDPEKKGTMEGYLGQVNYFTSDKQDADEHYAGGGPDLERRIEDLADRLYRMDVWDLHDWMQEANFSIADVEWMVGNSDALDEIARDHLTGDQDTTMELYTRLDNPAVINGDTETWIDLVPEGDRTREEVMADNPEMDEDGIDELLMMDRYENESPVAIAVEQAVFDVTGESGAGIFPAMEWGDTIISATELDEQLRANDELMYLDNERGESAGSHIIAEVFKNLGYDGIVVQNADKIFVGMRLNPGTAHIHVFGDTPNQIKSTVSEFTDDPRIKFSKSPQQEAADKWYSQMEKVLDKKLNNGPVVTVTNQLKAFAKKGEFKQEELEWSGVFDWLGDQHGKIKKDDVITWLKENNVQVLDIVKRGVTEDDIDIFLNDEMGEGFTREEAREYLQDDEQYTTKFSNPDYQLPGGTNYKEILLTLPTTKGPSFTDWMSQKGYDSANKAEHIAEYQREHPPLDKTGYKSKHWEEPNVLAHIRMTEREVDGKRVLHIEEIQSDWHQAGRKKGYKSDSKIADFTADPLREGSGNKLWKVKDKTGEVVGNMLAASEKEAIQRYINQGGDEMKTPNAPFKKTWPMLAMKKMVRYAAENGFDTIAWTQGEQQSERYDLSKQVSSVQYIPDTQKLKAFDLSGNAIMDQVVPENEIEDHIGKDVAKKLLESEGFVTGSGKQVHHLEGPDLKVGGEGMKGFYDKILPAEVNKFFGKKAWGSPRVEEMKITIPVEPGLPPTHKPYSKNLHSFPITPEMKQKALSEGMPLFSKAPPVTAEKLPGSEGVTRTRYRNKDGAIVGTTRSMGTTIGDVVVHKKYRRQGYGLAMLKYLLSEGGKRAIPVNDESEELFKKAGFKPIGGGYVEYSPDAKFSKTAAANIKDADKPIMQSDYDYVIAEDAKGLGVKAAESPSKIWQGIKDVAEDVKDGLDKYLGAISTRLGNIDVGVKAAVRKLSQQTDKNSMLDAKEVMPLIEKAKTKMTKADHKAWDYARKNSDVPMILKLVNQYGLQAEYDKYRAVLDKLRASAHEVGLSIGEIAEYAPRLLADPKGFLRALGQDPDWKIISRRLRERAAELGIEVEDMTQEQRAALISDQLHSGNYGMGGVSAAKKRKLAKIPKELDKYYADSDTALLNHIYSMNKAIEARKFFGKVPEKISNTRTLLHNTQARIREANKNMGGALSKAQERELAKLKAITKKTDAQRKRMLLLGSTKVDNMPAELEDKFRKRRNELIGLEKKYQLELDRYAAQRDFSENIGVYVDKLLTDRVNAGKPVTGKQEQQLVDILNARFTDKGTHGLWGAYKNMAYIDTMGSPISAITQIGDLAWAMYEGGVFGAIKYAGKSLVGKSRITKEQLGFERIGQEFADPSKLGGAVQTVFKWTGLTKMDAIGKETLVNSAFDRYKRDAKKNPDKLRKEISPQFGSETDQVIQDLLNDKVSENVELLLYNRLIDFQPMALSEMPEIYLKSGNGRIFYMLKSFTLKQFDIFRNEAFKKMASKDMSTRAEGIKNMATLAAFFVVANASADEIKDFILGRETDPEDRMWDNILRLFGVSKFVAWKARTEGLPSALAKQVLPPFKLGDSLYKDAISVGDGKGVEVLGSLPIFGKIAYWRAGRGVSKRGDRWDSQWSKEKAKLNKIKDRLEKSKNKAQFRSEHREDLAKLRKVNSLQVDLNRYRKVINKLKSKTETAAIRDRIKALEAKRESIIRGYFGRV